MSKFETPQLAPPYPYTDHRDRLKTPIILAIYASNPSYYTTYIERSIRAYISGYLEPYIPAYNTGKIQTSMNAYNSGYIETTIHA